jgi:lysozyme family protein
MQSTYEQAIAQVFKDEGGYTNESTDPGGPTNWGITIHDARQYWKPNASAQDVKSMPRSVAEQIYQEHYATPIRYNDLPAGVDYAVLDYAINSGIHKSVVTLQSLVGVTQDGVVGPNTITAITAHNSIDLIHRIYDERIAFLKTLHTWETYGHGWTNRCNNGRNLAIALASENTPGVASKTWLQLLIESLTKLYKPTKGN